MRWRKAKLLQENYKKTYWRLQNKHTESKRKEWKERERFVRKRSLLFHYMKDLHNVQVYIDIVNLRIQKPRITHKYLLEISSNNKNRLSHLNTCHDRILESVTNCCFAGMRWNAPCEWIRVASEKRTVWISEYTCQSHVLPVSLCCASSVALLCASSSTWEICALSFDWNKMLRKTEDWKRSRTYLEKACPTIQD